MRVWPRVGRGWGVSFGFWGTLLYGFRYLMWLAFVAAVVVTAVVAIAALSPRRPRRLARERLHLGARPERRLPGR
jgi:hypothetical protein